MFSLTADSSQKVQFLGKSTLFALTTVSTLSLMAPAWGALATFDDLPEGLTGTSITDNGITFSDLIAGFRMGPPQFRIASTDALVPFFSPPNYLTTESLFSGVSPEFGAFGSARISTGSLASSVSLDLFSSKVFEQLDSLIVLDAYQNGELVASTSASFSQFTAFGADNELLYKNLSLSGQVFDELQLYTPEAFADGVVYLGIDNVRIDEVASVPEPPTLLGTGTAVSMGLFLKRKLAKSSLKR